VLSALLDVDVDGEVDVVAGARRCCASIRVRIAVPWCEAGLDSNQANLGKRCND